MRFAKKCREKFLKPSVSLERVFHILPEPASCRESITPSWIILMNIIRHQHSVAYCLPNITLDLDAKFYFFYGKVSLGVPWLPASHSRCSPFCRSWTRSGTASLPSEKCVAKTLLSAYCVWIYVGCRCYFLGSVTNLFISLGSLDDT